MTNHRQKFAAGLATLAVLGAGAPLLAAPANAVSAKLDYTCQLPTIGAKTFAMTLDTNVADKVALNDKTAVNATASIVIPGDVTKAWYDAGYRSFSGSAKFAATQGTTPLTSAMTIAAQNLPQTGTTPTAPAATPTTPAATPTTPAATATPTKPATPAPTAPGTPTAPATTATGTPTAPATTATGTPTAPATTATGTPSAPATTATPTKPATPTTPAAPATTPAPPAPVQTPSPAPSVAKEMPLSLSGPLTGLKLDVVGDQIIKGGNASFVLVMKKADNSTVTLPEFTCAPANAAADLTVDKFAVVTKSTIALNGPAGFDYGSTAAMEAVVTTPGAAVAGNVKFTVGTQVTTVAIKDGKAVLPMPLTTAVGTYTVTAEFVPTDAKIEGSKATRQLIVSKDDTEMVVKIKRSKNSTALISVDSIKGQNVDGQVTAVIKRRTKTLKTIKATLKDGDTAIKLGKLAKGRYQLLVSYPGSTTMEPSSKSIRFAAR